MRLWTHGQLFAWSIWAIGLAVAVGGLAVAVNEPALVAPGLAVWLVTAPLVAGVTPVRIDSIARRRLIALSGISALLVAGSIDITISPGQAKLLAIFLLGLLAWWSALYLTWRYGGYGWGGWLIFALSFPLAIKAFLDSCDRYLGFREATVSRSIEEISASIEMNRLELGTALASLEAVDVESYVGDLFVKVLAEFPLDFWPAELRPSLLASFGERLGVPADTPVSVKMAQADDDAIEAVGRRRLTDPGTEIWDLLPVEERKRLFQGLLANVPKLDLPNANQVLRDHRVASEKQRDVEADVLARLRVLFVEEIALTRETLISRRALMVSIPLAAAMGDAVVTLWRGGAALVLMAFLLLWTAAVMVVWGIDPHAWRGLGRHLVRIGDFIYVAVGSAFGGTPGGIEPIAPAARMLLTVETLSGATLIGAYAASLWRGSP